YPANEGGRDFQAEGHPAARIEEPEGVTKNAGLEDACGGMLEKAAAGPLHRDETEGDPERGIEPRALEDRRRKTAFGAHFPCVLRVTVAPDDAMVLHAVADAREDDPERGDERIDRKCEVVEGDDRREIDELRPVARHALAPLIELKGAV